MLERGERFVFGLGKRTTLPSRTDPKDELFLNGTCPYQASVTPHEHNDAAREVENAKEP
jgi:hypothetical protein